MSTITLLDGGMGQELVKRSGKAPTPLWSTRVMMDDASLVRGVHDDFFAAGASIATTNTYAILRDRLAIEHVGHLFETLHDLAMIQAEEARAAHGKGRIAGAIGPLGASYRPDIHPTRADAIPLYREIAALHAPRCDIVLFETVASVIHARSALEATADLDRPVWLAVTVDDEDGSRLRSGEPVTDILPFLEGASAVLANCSAPEAMSAALETLARSGLPHGAYANGFTQITKDFLKEAPTVDALSARRDMGPEIYADHVMSWVAGGATIVGGCCEVGPAHIAEIARRLAEAGHDIA